MCGSIPDRATASKSNSLRDVPINTASLYLRLQNLSPIPMVYLTRPRRLRRLGMLPKPNAFTAFLMKCDPTNASAAFNLGNMLRACARNVEAEAVLRAATRIDPTFAEAWYNLGDLLDEQGRSEAAIECLRTALMVAPDYADAMFNLALLLQRKNQHAEAVDYWRRYLASDGQSEWAARARRSLKFCDMQVHLVVSA